MKMGLGEVLDNFAKFFDKIGEQIAKYDFATAIKDALLNGFELAMSLINAAQRIVFPILIALDIPGIVYEALKTLSSLFEMLNDVVRAITPGLEQFVLRGLVPIAEWLGGKIRDGLQFLQEQFKKIGDWFTEHGDMFTKLGIALGDVVAKIWEFWEPIADSAWQTFKDIISTIVDIALDLIEAFSETAIKISETRLAVQSFLDSIGVLDLLQASIQTTFQNFGNAIKMFAENIGTILTGIVENFGFLMDFIKSVFTGDWEAAWQAIKDVFANIFGTIGEVLSNVWNTLVADWETFCSNFKGKWDTFWEGISSFFGKIWDNIVLFFTTSWDSIVEFFSLLPERIGYVIGLLVGKFTKFITDIGSWIQNDLPKLIDGIVKWFSELPQRIWDWLVSAYEKVKQWGTNIITWATNEIPKFVNKVIQFFKELPAKIFQVGKDIVSNIWNGIVSMTKWIGDKISGFIGGLVSGFTKGFGKETEETTPNSKTSRNVETTYSTRQIGKIPQLAKGGVLTAPRLVMAGEYAGAGSNPEIVTPQSIMHETMIKANQPVLQAIQMLAKIMQDNQGQTIELDGYTLGKVIRAAESNNNYVMGV